MGTFMSISFLNRFIHVAFLSTSILLISSCSSSSDDDDDEGAVNPTLPADATTITAANASAIAAEAIGALETFDDLLLRSELGQEPSIGDAYQLVIDKAFAHSHSSGKASGRSTETEACSEGGSVTISYDETETSESGTVSFANCREFGLLIHGSLTYSSSWDNNTGAYTDAASGSISVSGDGVSGSLSLLLNETGNEFTGSYSTTVSLSVSGSPDGNYLLTTQQPITGIDPNVSGGVIIVQGANNSRLRISVTNTNVADVELDDGDGTYEFVETIFI
jgi:hypothetical protein